MAGVTEAVAAIRAGLPVVLPFDGVYGLCSRAHTEEATRRIYRLKGREPSKPTALVAPDLERLVECVPELGGDPGHAARALLPGPYTLVLPNPARRFPWLAGATPDKIGVRVPALAGPAKAVLDAAGCVAATSANLAGGAEPRRLEDVPEEIRAGCAAVVDGGDLPGTPSTVLDLTEREPVVLREGAVPAAEALEALARAR